MTDVVFLALWRQCLEWQALCRDEHFARRPERLQRQPPSASSTGHPEHADAPATRRRTSDMRTASSTTTVCWYGKTPACFSGFHLRVAAWIDAVSTRRAGMGLAPLARQT